MFFRGEKIKIIRGQEKLDETGRASSSSPTRGGRATSENSPEIDVKINPRISLLITQQMAHKTTQAVKFIANSLKLKSGLLSPRTASCCARFLSSEADGESLVEIAK
jgi:hypothetical protein